MADYIRTYLGLMQSGKTTRALADIKSVQRALVYSPVTTNPRMLEMPYILDTPDYLNDWPKWIHKYPQLRIEKRVAPSPVFGLLSRVRGYAILLDDVAALRVEPEEKRDFQALVRTIAYNGNVLLLTTHRAHGDISPLVRTVGSSFYYVGPGTLDSDEIKTLYALVNYPISRTEFEEKLRSNPARTATRPPGVFPIRRAS